MNDEQQKKDSHFVTHLSTIERQVGEHVLAALEDPDAVAVLTTIASGIRADRVVSMPLSSAQVADISSVLAQAQIEPDEETDEPTIGFHVVLETPEESDDDDAQGTPEADAS
ncbi:MAG: hypothetical protein P8L37_08150 [Phycisphaerales bacterium]|nr:hypothetical protein [Phycisphaerales bacterium]